jgi:hypothetical protein
MTEPAATRHELDTPTKNWIVGYYLATGNVSEAARKENVNPWEGQHIVKWFKEMGTTANKPRPGHPKLLSDAGEHAIV